MLDYPFNVSENFFSRLRSNQDSESFLLIRKFFFPVVNDSVDEVFSELSIAEESGVVFQSDGDCFPFGDLQEVS